MKVWIGRELDFPKQYTIFEQKPRFIDCVKDTIDMARELPDDYILSGNEKWIPRGESNQIKKLFVPIELQPGECKPVVLLGSEEYEALQRNIRHLETANEMLINTLEEPFDYGIS